MSQNRIVAYLETRIAGDDPRRLGQPLHGGLASYWRYRVGPYRIVCSIDDERVLVLVADIAHRREVYRSLPRM